MSKHDMIDLKELEELLVEHGACIRAIPKTVISVVEVRHVNDPEYERPEFIRKEVVYVERFKREMLVTERVPHHAGMFLVKTGEDTSSMVRFSGKKYYKTLKEAIEAIKESPKMSEAVEKVKDYD